MLNIEITLTVLNLILLVGGAFAVGFIFRSQQLQKKQFKISELRKEIVYNHAQILELQKEYVDLENSQKGTITPVLPLMTIVMDVKESAAL
jgi:hypothetical protein